MLSSCIWLLYWCKLQNLPSSQEVLLGSAVLECTFFMPPSAFLPSAPKTTRVTPRVTSIASIIWGDSFSFRQFPMIFDMDESLLAQLIFLWYREAC